MSGADLDTQGPALEIVRLLSSVSGEERGPSTMHEEHAEVRVASFGDVAQSALEP